MIRFGPVTRLLAVPTLTRLGLLLLLVVAVFMAESFTSLLEQALRNDAGSGAVLWLLLMQAPEIMDLALALGVLIAVYFAVLDSRNRGEMVILATTGIRWTRVVGFVLLLGIIGGAFSFGIAGYVIPKARYGERIATAQLRTAFILQQVTTPGAKAARQTIMGTTFIATPPSSADQERGQLFVFQPDQGGSWRVSQSRDWTVVGPDADNKHAIRLSTLRAYDGSFTAQPPRAISVFSVNHADMSFDLGDVARAPDFVVRNREKLLQLSASDAKRLTHIGARALLVPTAALLALAAVLAAGAGLARFVTLPIATVLLLLYDVAGRTLIGDAALTLPPLTLAALAIAAYLGPPLAYVLWRGEDIMKPARESG